MAIGNGLIGGDWQRQQDALDQLHDRVIDYITNGPNSFNAKMDQLMGDPGMGDPAYAGY
jgi:hypothetical protein